MRPVKSSHKDTKSTKSRSVLPVAFVSWCLGVRPASRPVKSSHKDTKSTKSRSVLPVVFVSWCLGVRLALRPVKSSHKDTKSTKSKARNQYGNRIVEASFWANGCLSTMACGDMLTTLAEGRTLAEAAAITPEELIAALDGLPLNGRHCAELSVETLREAIASVG